MKLQIASDLHHGLKSQFDFPESESDVLILAGDIAPLYYGIELAERLADKHQKPVLYVAGNHEYYFAEYHELLSEMREKASYAEGVHFLENDVFEYQGVRFLGTTLWTSYALDGRFNQKGSMDLAGEVINDHRCISFGESDFKPSHALELHHQARQFLKAELAKPYAGKTVVITHHAPSLKCEHPDFGINPLAGAFMSHCDPLMANADVWIFGHTHANKDLYVSGCRLISNQMGYARENLEPPYRHELIVEV